MLHNFRVNAGLEPKAPVYGGWESVKTWEDINGGGIETSRRRGSFISLRRRWRSGDVIDVELPMALRIEPLPGSTDTAAVVYGPIVLVGALGHAVKPGEDLHVNERTIGTTLNEPIDVPVLAGDLADIPSKIRPTGEPLTFKTVGDDADIQQPAVGALHLIQRTAMARRQQPDRRVRSDARGSRFPIDVAPWPRQVTYDVVSASAAIVARESTAGPPTYNRTGPRRRARKIPRVLTI